jgi:prepilin-type N-terminal cleavage/methylation domain-containing protein
MKQCLAKKLSSYRAIELNRGFSLLELLLYIAVISIITLVLSSTLVSIYYGRGAAESRMEVNADLNYVFNRLGQDLKAEDSVMVSVPELAGATSSVLTFTAAGATITYDVDSGKVRRTADAVPQYITGDDVAVDSLSFTRIENANASLSKTFISISVAMQARYNGTSSDKEFTESKETTFTLR